MLWNLNFETTTIKKMFVCFSMKHLLPQKQNKQINKKNNNYNNNNKQANKEQTVCFTPLTVEVMS